MTVSEPPPVLPLETKVCTGPCGLEKPVTSFARSGPNGYRRVCGACMSEAMRKGNARSLCIQCLGSIAPSRQSLKNSTCSRACLLESVGLPPTFDAEWDLRTGAEKEVRDTLEAVLLAVRGGAK